MSSSAINTRKLSGTLVAALCSVGLSVVVTSSVMDSLCLFDTSSQLSQVIIVDSCLTNVDLTEASGRKSKLQSLIDEGHSLLCFWITLVPCPFADLKPVHNLCSHAWSRPAALHKRQEKWGRITAFERLANVWLAHRNFGHGAVHFEGVIN